MVPETNAKASVKSKASNDTASQLAALLIVLINTLYYTLTKEWQHTSPFGFYIIFGLILVQITLLRLPKTKKNVHINSGGIVPISLYNIGALVFFTLYLPLYSPFIVILPAIMFITIYYKSIAYMFLSIANFILLVTISTVKYGYPNVPYGHTYPFMTVMFGICFAIIVNRAGSIDNKIRSDLEEVSQKIAEERQRLNSLINSISNPVIATDENGNIVFFNSSSLKLFGQENIEIGKPFSRYVSLFDENSAQVDFFSLFKPDQSQQTINNLHLLRNNEKVSLGIDISKVSSIDNQNKKQGLILLIRDITKEKTLDEERDEFAAITSHELRTPIATAEANISLAMNDRFMSGLDIELKDRLKKAHQSILYLSDLINQLAELSNIESPSRNISYDDVEPEKIFSELYNFLVSSVTEKGLALNMNVEENVGTVHTSRIYLTEILENFLTNAIKYTQKGTITLSAESSKDNSSIIFSVSDTGDGISEADKEKIFHKFYRAEDYRTMATRGTGLGLYLTLKLARYLNGKIWFNSILGSGSTFFLQIPKNGNSLNTSSGSSSSSPVE